MSKRKHVIETIKSALILFLVAGTALLLWKTYEAIRLSYEPREYKLASGSAHLAIGDISSAELMPAVITVKNSEGRRGAAYTRSAVADMLGQAKTRLAKAFVSSSWTNETSDDEEWLAALAMDGIFIDYGEGVPEEYLRGILGADTENSSGKWIKCLMLADDGHSVNMYYKCGENGDYYKTHTALETGFAGEISAQGGKYAAFAGLHADKYPNVRPEFVIIDELPPMLQQTAAVVSSTKVLDMFNIDQYTAGSYIDEYGAQVYLQQEEALKISGAEVSYRSNAGVPMSKFTGSDGMTDTRAELHVASALVNGISERYSGDAALYLTGIYPNGNTDTISFGLSVNGVMIEKNDGGRTFATVTIDRVKKSVIAAKIKTIGFTSSNIDETLLKPKQAAALGKSPILLYRPYGKTGLYRPVWVEGSRSKP